LVWVFAFLISFSQNSTTIFPLLYNQSPHVPPLDSVDVHAAETFDEISRFVFKWVRYFVLWGKKQFLFEFVWGAFGGHVYYQLKRENVFKGLNGDIKIGARWSTSSQNLTASC
jgi:hypothetical protein